MGHKEIGERIAQQEWVLEFIRENHSADVLNAEFHDGFAKEFNAPQVIKMYGACPCAKAMAALKALYSEGSVRRYRIGIGGMGEGFPTWVYSYTLT